MANFFVDKNEWGKRQRSMSDSSDEEVSFYYLLEKQLRSPDFLKKAENKVKAKFNPDKAVNSIFDLIKSVDELNKWVAETNFPSKYTKYIEFKHEVKQILARVSVHMVFNKNSTLTQEITNLLRENLREYFVELGQLENKRFKPSRVLDYYDF